MKDQHFFVLSYSFFDTDFPSLFTLYLHDSFSDFFDSDSLSQLFDSLSLLPFETDYFYDFFEDSPSYFFFLLSKAFLNPFPNLSPCLSTNLKTSSTISPTFLLDSSSFYETSESHSDSFEDY